MVPARRSRAAPRPGQSSEASIPDAGLSEGRAARRHAARRLRSRRLRAVLADESNGQGLGQWLSYSARVIEAGTTCASAVFENGTGTAVVPRGSAVTASSESSQELAEDRGSVVSYCLELTLPEDAPNEAQGTQRTPLWEFRATSSPE